MLCYRVLEVVHNLLPPVGVRSIKDYVTSPKPNGYQSLHSSVHIGQLTAELQVRTSEMHRYAEHGKASHWLYKTDEARPADDWQRVAELAATDIAASGPRAASGPLVMKSWRQAIAGSSFGAGAQPLESAAHRVPPPPTVATPGTTAAPPGAAFSGVGGAFPRAPHGGEALHPPPLLEPIRKSLREKRVYATTSDGRILSLRAGADLSEALQAWRDEQAEEAAEAEAEAEAAAAREEEEEDGGVGLSVGLRGLSAPREVATAMVNGRTVRLDYKIRNGDILTLQDSAPLTSGAFSMRGRDADAADDEGIDALDGGEEDGFAAAPWPWSLVGSNAVEDNYAWYAEAEWKHGRIALLALANWLALCAAGQVGLDSEPLTSLANPVPAALWSIQAGGVALSEARNFQLSVDAVAAGDAVGDSYSNFSRPWRWNDASGVSRAVAVLQTAMIGPMPAAMAERLAEREGPGPLDAAAAAAAGRLGGGGGRGGGRGHPPRLPGRVDRARPLRDAGDGDARAQRRPREGRPQRPPLLEGPRDRLRGADGRARAALRGARRQRRDLRLGGRAKVRRERAARRRLLAARRRAAELTNVCVFVSMSGFVDSPATCS